MRFSGLIAMMLGSQFGVDVEVAVWVGGDVMKVGRGVAERVVTNASLSRSAKDTSLSKGASAEEAWAIMSGRSTGESVVENMMARTMERVKKSLYKKGWVVEVEERRRPKSAAVYVSSKEQL